MIVRNVFQRKWLYMRVILCTIIFIMFLSPISTFAEENYRSFTPRSVTSNENYQIYLDDWANLLSDTEEEKLFDIMEPIAEYGNVAFVSILQNPMDSTENYIEQYYYDHFAFDSGTVFVIDMDERYLWIYSNGEIYETVTNAYANTITDNVYVYASEGDYFTCASVAFEQIHTLLLGRPIAQPMKYISNALLALVLALLINYGIVMLYSRSKKANTKQLLDGIYSNVTIHNPSSHFLHKTKRYSPQNRSSGGSSAGSGARGGSGGGGSHGGGGGHRF